MEWFNVKKRTFILIVLTGTVVALIASSLVYFLFAPRQLRYKCKLTELDGKYTLFINEVYTDGETLFRCAINVKYITKEGSWKTVTKSLGTVDITNKDAGGLDLEGFQPGPDINLSYFGPTMRIFEFDEKTKLESIQINAYGFKFP